MPSAEVEKARIYNVNVGVLGHVDSGKTSLGMHMACAALPVCFYLLWPLFSWLAA